MFPPHTDQDRTACLRKVKKRYGKKDPHWEIPRSTPQEQPGCAVRKFCSSAPVADFVPCFLPGLWEDPAFPCSIFRLLRPSASTRLRFQVLLHALSYPSL